MADMPMKERQMAAEKGQAMPGGRFPIRNGDDLENAIRAVGRVKPMGDESPEEARAMVRRHIMRRAKALNLSNRIPENWAADGSLKS